MLYGKMSVAIELIALVVMLIAFLNGADVALIALLGFTMVGGQLTTLVCALEEKRKS